MGLNSELAGGKSGGAAVTDATIATSDITTNNVSTTKHGFAPKGDANAAHYLDGTGAYSTPAGSGLPTDGSGTGATAQSQAFTNGVKTAATTGLVGVGMTPNAMLDVTAPASTIAIQAVGTQPAAVSAGNGTAAVNVLTLAAPAGGDTSHTQANRVAGLGGGLTITLGAGGQQTGASSGTARGGIGGTVAVTAGGGGAATAVTGTVKGGAGGAIQFTSGSGGTSATSTGGVGGAIALAASVGGFTTGSAASGKGGGITLVAGNGGDNAQAAGTAGAGGDITITPGAAGAISGGATAASAGQIILAGEILASDISRVAGDLTNATTTFGNMTGISRTVLAAGNYTGRLVVKCINSTATEGLKFDFNGGTATMTNFWAGAGILASGGTDVIGTSIATSLAGVINFTTFTGESVIIFEISFTVANAGTVIPRFAENSTAVGTATVRLGSFMDLRKSN